MTEVKASLLKNLKIQPIARPSEDIHATGIGSIDFRRSQLEKRAGNDENYKAFLLAGVEAEEIIMRQFSEEISDTALSGNEDDKQNLESKIRFAEFKLIRKLWANAGLDVQKAELGEVVKI